MANNYSYQYIDPATNQANGTRFFSLLKTVLGTDYKGWDKHPDFETVLEFAHNSIFHSPKPYKKGSGLQLMVHFLQKADTVTKETKKKRESTYHDSLMYAMVAGVVSQEFYLNHRK
jgi:hypothetical protein